MLIELRDLSFTYFANNSPDQAVLKGINLSIRKGEFIGLIGPTGSGKSTLAQHLNGLLFPTSGKIFFKGKEVGKDIHPNEIRKEVGLVFQFPESQLFEESVARDVAFGPRNLGLPEKEVRRRVKESLGLVGFDYAKFADRSPFKLSGGEMRLVALAGVLAMGPSMLVLDEPTSGLDARGKARIMDCLAKLNQSGLTILVISHDVDELAQLAKRIIVLDAGKILLDDKTEKVFAGVDLLRNIGLDVPKTMEILIRLKACGLDVAIENFGLKEAANSIIAAMRRA
ncbi:MAG: energy-coupling factor transporter ATPase [Actinomycetota bacterium]